MEMICQMVSKAEGPELEYGPPASEESLGELESALGVELPAHLRGFLTTSDGAYMSDAHLQFLWTVHQIKERNLEMRTDPILAEIYMPFDHLLFFGEAGNGDLFGFPISADGHVSNNVFAWNHEDDSRHCVASSMKWFISNWLSGKIST